MCIKGCYSNGVVVRAIGATLINTGRERRPVCLVLTRVSTRKGVGKIAPRKRELGQTVRQAGSSAKGTWFRSQQPSRRSILRSEVDRLRCGSSRRSEK